MGAGTGRSASMSSPRRRKIGSGVTWTRRKRSPDGPPFGPGTRPGRAGAASRRRRFPRGSSRRASAARSSRAASRSIESPSVACAERDLHRGLDVAPPPLHRRHARRSERTRVRAAPDIAEAAAEASAEAAAEQVAEAPQDLVDRDRLLEASAAVARPPGPRRTPPAGSPYCSCWSYWARLPGVGEDGVGLAQLLELLLGHLVVGVLVGVVLDRELAVGALDLLLRSRPRTRRGSRRSSVPWSCLVPPIWVPRRYRGRPAPGQDAVRPRTATLVRCPTPPPHPPRPRPPGHRHALRRLRELDREDPRPPGRRRRRAAVNFAGERVHVEGRPALDAIDAALARGGFALGTRDDDASPASATPRAPRSRPSTASGRRRGVEDGTPRGRARRRARDARRAPGPRRRAGADASQTRRPTRRPPGGGGTSARVEAPLPHRRRARRHRRSSPRIAPRAEPASARRSAHPRLLLALTLPVQFVVGWPFLVGRARRAPKRPRRHEHARGRRARSRPSATAPGSPSARAARAGAHVYFETERRDHRADLPRAMARGPGQGPRRRRARPISRASSPRQAWLRPGDDGDVRVARLRRVLRRRPAAREARRPRSRRRPRRRGPLDASTSRCSPASRFPWRRAAGDDVTGGTLNGSGTFVMEATAVGADTVLHRIVAWVRGGAGREGARRAPRGPRRRRVRAGRDRHRRRSRSSAWWFARVRRRGLRDRARPRGGRADHRVPVCARSRHADGDPGRHRARRRAGHPPQGRRGARAARGRRHRRARQDRHPHARAAPDHERPRASTATRTTLLALAAAAETRSEHPLAERRRARAAASAAVERAGGRGASRPSRGAAASRARVEGRDVARRAARRSSPTRGVDVAPARRVPRPRRRGGRHAAPRRRRRRAAAAALGRARRGARRRRRGRREASGASGSHVVAALRRSARRRPRRSRGGSGIERRPRRGAARSRRPRAVAALGAEGRRDGDGRRRRERRARARRGRRRACRWAARPTSPPRRRASPSSATTSASCPRRSTSAG